MSLSQSEFVNAAREFLLISDRLDDGWRLEHDVENSPDTSLEVYLVKNVIRELKTSCSSEKNDRKCEDSEEAPQQRDQLLQWEYNVAYSVSYEAPVLYFDICRSDGTTLSLEEAWAVCSSEGKILDLHLKDMWSTVTRQEHPITRRPYFALHPCNTHKLMAPLLGAQGDRRMNYLITWLSSIGPAVGLRLPIGYCGGHSKDIEK